MIKNKSIKLAIIGLGYVGLPLFLEFSKKEILLVLILMRPESMS